MHKKLMCAALGTLMLQGMAFASNFATGGNEVLIEEDHTVAHIFTESGTFTLNESKSVRILAVGGGGGGGAECGGGGGGGGVVEYQSIGLEPGVYTVTVGAGGLGGKQGTNLGNGSQRGTNGGDTIVTNEDGEVIIHAYGGGGGGSWQVRAGVSGASGGGAAAGGAGGATIDATQGNAAGNASGGSKSLPTGGAGAGAPSESITLSSGQGLSGSGGAGIISDITGTEEMYGAGGGGGNYNYGDSTDQAPGGDGIGGFGQGNTSSLSGNEKGRDGFGGGGGGGSNRTTYIAADGGCGTVIFRLSAYDIVSEIPVFVIYNQVVSVDKIDLMLSILEAGSESSDETVSVYAQIADSADAWNEETGEFSGKERLIAAGVKTGNVDVVVDALRPSHEYVVRIVLRNDAGAEAASDLISFSTLALEDNRWTMNGISGQPGLYQYSFSDSGNNDLDKEFDETTPNLTVQVGAIIAGVSNNHSNGIHGQSYTDADGNRWVVGAYMSYAYMGYMFLEAGVTYNFFKYFYDGVRLEIDGQDLIRNSNYGAINTASYTSDRTGWHRIRIWLTAPSGNNFGVPPGGWTLGLGYNTNGVSEVTGKPGSDWLPIENTQDNEFLRTYPTGRIVDISSWSIDTDNNSAIFNASYGEAYDASELYAVWGPIHGGDTLEGWKHVVKLGDIDTNSGAASFTVNDISDLVWFKFVAVDENGLNAWSTSQLVDLSNPSIGISKVVHNGDQATISVRVDSVGTGDFSLNILWGENADLSDASVTNVAVTAPGVYDVVVDVTPGATTYFKAEAETSDGGKDETIVDSFTTLTASSIGNVVAHVDKHWINFEGTILTAGAGTTVITLWTGDSPETLVPDPETVTIQTVGQFSFRRLFPGEEKVIYWKFTCENVGSGGTSWITETAVNRAQTFESGVIYRWKSDVLDGDWKDTNNWTTATEGAFGYPAYCRAEAAFPDNSTNKIHLVGYVESRIDLRFAKSDITIYGDGADSSYLYTEDTTHPATLNQSTFRIDNMTLVEHDMFDYSLSDDDYTDSRIVVTNNACLNMGGGKWAIVGKNTNITISPDSLFYFGNTDVPVTNKLDRVLEEWRLFFGAEGESLTIEGKAIVRDIYVVTPLGDTPQSFRLRGQSAFLNVLNGIFGDTLSINNDKHRLFKTDQPLTKDMDIIFEPAAGNYTNVVSYVVDDVEYTEEVPFVSLADSERAFAEMELGESTGKVRISVDTTSMVNSLRSTKQHLLLWKSGINTSNVELVQGEGYNLYYTYGWPSTAMEPSVEGELPTGVWGHVPAMSGMMIIIK